MPCKRPPLWKRLQTVFLPEMLQIEKREFSNLNCYDYAPGMNMEKLQQDCLELVKTSRTQTNELVGINHNSCMVRWSRYLERERLEKELFEGVQQMQDMCIEGDFTSGFMNDVTVNGTTVDLYMRWYNAAFMSWLLGE